jgi:retinol dehydrogenase-12
MACPYAKSKDGFELQMGTNHFGHFYFTQLLLPLLHSSRIVNVSSAAHFMWRVPCDASHYAQMCNPNTYHPWSAYSLSKTANILFTRELQQRYSTSYNIRAYSLHPGSVNTQLDRHIGFNQFLRQIIKPIRYVICKTPLEGAQTNLYCALSDEAKPGEYHADCQPISVLHKYAKDDKLAEEWWNYSEKIIDEKLKNIEQR